MIPQTDSPYTAAMSPQQRVWFYQAYEAARKDEILGVFFALIFGSFGAHHFYLRRNGLGILYAVFFWTGVPAVLGFIECFLMPGRIRRYNTLEAATISANILATPAYPFSAADDPAPRVCPACGRTQHPAARFCTSCGTTIQQAPADTLHTVAV